MAWNPLEVKLHTAHNRTVGEACNIENLGTIDKSPTVTKALSSLVSCIPMDLGWVKAKILKIDTHVIKTADKKWRITARCKMQERSSHISQIQMHYPCSNIA